MELGKHNVKAISAYMGESSTGSGFLSIGFENELGEKISWVKTVNGTVISGGKDQGKTNAQVAIETLGKCGFQGSIIDLGDEPSNDFCEVDGGITIEVAEREYEGKTRKEVKWINFGFESKANAMEKSKVAESNSKFNLSETLAAIKKEMQGKVKLKETKPDSTFDTDDIPF